MRSAAQIKNAPAILVILGATGDLAVRKIIPSLWHLFRQGRLPRNVSIVGFSRGELGDAQFRAFVREAALKRGGEDVRDEDLSHFLELFAFQAGVFADEGAFRALSRRISETERSWGACANKLFYLAVPPSLFGPILKNLAAVKLNVPCGGETGWSRVLIEKPFGADLASAQALQSLLSAYFTEEQIYRIDHYLFKEIVQGIENFRFSNNLFETIWDNTTIERIDIRLLESIGVEERGSFYDSVGTLRDVGQNHMLSMLAALTMEHPESASADAARKSRESVLQTLAPWTKEEVQNNTYRAQYRGYKNIEGVNQDSEKETYFALKTELRTPRWSGIPIFLEAGKRMAKARKEIVLTLKHPKVCLLCEVGPHEPNRIIFRLEPNDEIVIHFWTKKPGFEEVLEERTFTFFLYEKKAKVQYVEEYAKIFHAAMEGERALFISPQEVEFSWKFIDPIEDGWKQRAVQLAQYEPGADVSPVLLTIAPDDADGEKKASAGDIGIIGLGKMGANLARRLQAKQRKVVGFNKTPEVTKELESEGVSAAYSLRELVDALPTPRTLWLMVPYQVVDAVLNELVPLLAKGDTILDGGNTPYKESMRRGRELAGKHINFFDVGVSGGPSGARNGACLMVGGEREWYERFKPLFADIAAPDAYGYMGKSGAGHFVKMVHNGIEYGMMQSIAEGFAVLNKSKCGLPLAEVARVYNNRSVIESRLVGWLRDAFEAYGEALDEISGEVAATGEGAWTVEAAKALGVPAPVIEDSVRFREQSKGNPTYAGKILSALRNQFGGHDAKKK